MTEIINIYPFITGGDMSWLSSAIGGFTQGAVSGCVGQSYQEPKGGSNPPKNWQKTNEVYRSVPKAENVAVPATVTLDVLPPDHNPVYYPSHTNTQDKGMA
jgi:hypothetical protein